MKKPPSNDSLLVSDPMTLTLLSKLEHTSANAVNGTPAVSTDQAASKNMPVIISSSLGNAEDNNLDSLKKTEADSMLEMILKSLRSHEYNQTQRLAFESDPVNVSKNWGIVYRYKSNLTPDSIIKRIIGPQGDELVCQILQARANHMASFGRPRTSRFALGFEFELMKGVTLNETTEEYQQIRQRLRQLTEIIWNCGYGDVQDSFFRPNFSQFLKMITRDGLAYGRFAVELIWQVDPKTGQKRCYAFRPVDAGTIYHIVPQQEHDQSTRTEALQLLSQLKNIHFDKEKYLQDKYKWIQVIEGRPVQAFTEDELIVYNLYPITNVEYDGYPLTPIDQALSAITTHINITLHNKLYFQHGRAARGMLIVQSDDIDEGTIQKIRLQFHQSINSVQNSWRMPVFGVGSTSQITWHPIDVSGRDAEFQYLADSNARVILSAFQMSPEELPGYAHLARGTNTQALAEADNEWKLVAARDVGLRPLLYDIQDFINTHVLPRFDEEISKTFQLVFAGLEHDSPEKESVRLMQDAALYLTYNDILGRVEKEKLPVEVGGKFPLNAQFGQIIDKYLSVGEILENFFGRKGAASDPRFNYYNNPMWLQYQQLLIQKTQLSLQMAMQQSLDAQMPPQLVSPMPQMNEEERKAIEQENITKQEDWLSQNYLLLEKAINHNSHHITNMLLRRHKESVDHAMSVWERASREAIKRILNTLKS